MLGGHCLYRGGAIFAIMFRGRLYLKVDEQSKGDFVARGMRPFLPNERQPLTSYFEAPPGVPIAPEALMSCAGAAILAGQAPQNNPS